jgi:hypothetical protein
MKKGDTMSEMNWDTSEVDAVLSDTSVGQNFIRYILFNEWDDDKAASAIQEFCMVKHSEEFPPDIHYSNVDWKTIVLVQRSKDGT